MKGKGALLHISISNIIPFFTTFLLRSTVALSILQDVPQNYTGDSTRSINNMRVEEKHTDKI